MRLRPLSLAVPFLAVLVGMPVVFAGCSDDDPAAPSPDAGTDTSTPDPGPGPGPDPVPDSGGQVEASTDIDAGDAGDGGASTNIGGFYTMTGTCSNAAAPARVMCVRQNASSVTGGTEFYRQVYTGTVAAGGVTATGTVPAPQECTGTVTGGKLATFACLTPSTTVTCNLTLTPSALRLATDTCCSVTAQDCGANERCQPLGNATDFLVNGCIPDRGTVDLDGACARLSNDKLDVGNDDCKKGLICGAFGLTNAPPYTCQKLCTATPDCGAGSVCLTNGLTGGVCRPKCDVFPGGTAAACAANTTCRAENTEAPAPAADRALDLTCGPLGTTAAGGACTGNGACVAGHGCVGGTCKPYCDTAHACAAGTCTALPGGRGAGVEPSFGVCQ